MNTVKREFIIYFAIFILLSFFMHINSWLSFPIEHIKHLLSHHVFPTHPLVYAFIGYILFWFIRLIFEPLFKKKTT